MGNETKKEGKISLFSRFAFCLLLLVTLFWFFILIVIAIINGEEGISSILLLILYLVLMLIVLKPMLLIAFRGSLPIEMDYKYKSKLFQSVEVMRYLIKGNDSDSLTELFLDEDFHKKKSVFKKIKSGLKKIFLFIAVLVVSTTIISQIRGYYADDLENLIIGIALASLVIFIWKKIDNRYFKSDSGDKRTISGQNPQCSLENQAEDDNDLLLLFEDDEDDKDKLNKEMSRSK
ncbi:MAG: hypothetical protein WAV73_00730 [Candidatus Moraniibacteriota bacterium]